MEYNRRDILAGGSSIALLVALGGCEKLKKQIQNRPVRKDVSTLANNDPILQAYRDAIAQMQALPASDPRNWNAQALIHQNFCPHGNWFFLPWHRAYLMSFEKIIRKLSGVADFGLPYWNWSCHRAIPAPFWEAGSVLNHSPRDIGPSDQADISVVGPNNIASILAEPDFEMFASGAATALRGGGGFTGRLEGEPHNYIHGSFIGGTMASYMSPLDPIFWHHHNILDYLWYAWNSNGNANTNDPVYTGMNITGQFCDGDGNPASYNVGAMPLAPLISYRFEPPVNCPELAAKVDDAVMKKFLETGARVRLETRRAFPAIGKALSIGMRPGVRGAAAAATRLTLPPDAAKIGFDPASPDRLVLRLDDVMPPTDENFFVRVFVGLPEGENPTAESSYYAGSFAFFTDTGAHHMASTFLVDVSAALARLRAAGKIASENGVTVTLVPVPSAGKRGLRAAGTPPLSIGAISPVLIARKPKPQPLK